MNRPETSALEAILRQPTTATVEDGKDAGLVEAGTIVLVMAPEAPEGVGWIAAADHQKIPRFIGYPPELVATLACAVRKKAQIMFVPQGEDVRSDRGGVVPDPKSPHADVPDFIGVDGLVMVISRRVFLPSHYIKQLPAD